MAVVENHARMRGGELVDLRSRAVMAAVVDEDDLARDATPVEDALGPIDELESLDRIAARLAA